MSKKFMVQPEAQSKSMNCWHASASMIWNYWQGITGRQGPMNTLAAEWVANNGISDFIALGKKAGLKEVTPRPSSYSSKVLEGILTRCGPLWCAGNWYGPGHVIVLTGVDGEQIYLNDPDGGLKKKATVSWFNVHLYNVSSGCLLYKDPNAY